MGEKRQIKNTPTNVTPLQKCWFGNEIPDFLRKILKGLKSYLKRLIDTHCMIDNEWKL